MSPKEEYSRADVRRKFGLSERQLRSWERQRLIAAATSYSFSDLIAFQTLIKLRENKISSKEILRALESLREKLGWVKQPLSELRVVSDGRRIAVQLSGQKMEAISGQILFDFDAGELGGVRSFPKPTPKISRSHESEAWFQKGLELEESGAPVEDAVDAYRKVLDLNPGAAGALVNLGTIYYRLHKFEEAEKYYLAAIEADPEYPLAQFNLALLCERQGEAMKAVHHWKAYLKLDRSGQWADIARRQLERLRQAVLM